MQKKSSSFHIIPEDGQVDFPGENTRKAFHLWDELRGSCKLPARTDFTPERLTTLMSWVVICDAVQNNGKWRFRYRLSGNMLTRHIQPPPRDAWLDEVYSEERLSGMYPAYIAAVTSGMPNIAFRKLPIDEGPVLEYWRLILPFADDNENTDSIVLVHDFLNYEQQMNPGLPMDIPASSDIYKKKQ